MEDQNIYLMVPTAYPIGELIYCVEDKAVHPHTKIRTKLASEPDDQWQTHTINANEPENVPEIAIPIGTEMQSEGQYLQVQVIAEGLFEAIIDGVDLWYQEVNDGSTGHEPAYRLRYNRGSFNSQVGTVPLAISSEDGKIAIWVSRQNADDHDHLVIGDFVIDPDWTAYDVCTAGVPPANGINFFFVPGSTVTFAPSIFSAVDQKVSLTFLDPQLNYDFPITNSPNSRIDLTPHTQDLPVRDPEGNAIGYRVTLQIQNKNHLLDAFKNAKIRMPIAFETDGTTSSMTVRTEDGDDQTYLDTIVVVTCTPPAFVG